MPNESQWRVYTKYFTITILATLCAVLAAPIVHAKRGYFQNAVESSDNRAHVEGRARPSKDGSLLFTTVAGGVR